MKLHVCKVRAAILGYFNSSFQSDLLNCGEGVTLASNIKENFFFIQLESRILLHFHRCTVKALLCCAIFSAACLAMLEHVALQVAEVGCYTTMRS